MRKLTVAEIREKYLYRLAERSDKYASEPAATVDRARRAFNSFYRLAGFSERLFYINNDEELYNHYRRRIDEMENREDKWIKRVNGYLSEFHASAVFNGIYPSICEERKPNDHGCIIDLNLTSWY